jgi:hypothetical protein
MKDDGLHHKGAKFAKVEKDGEIGEGLGRGWMGWILEQRKNRKGRKETVDEGGSLEVMAVV